MALSDDQRAMLRLLAQREQGYEDIGALMGLSVEEVRAKVREALDQLDEPAKPTPGASRPEKVAAPPERIEEPPPPPGNAVPETPTAPASPAAESRPLLSRASLPDDRRVLAAGAVGGAAVVVLIILLVTGTFSGGGSSTPAASSGSTTAANSPAAAGGSSQQLTQAVLAPVNGGNARGRALFGRVRNTPVLEVVAQGLTPSPQGQSYTVWLYHSPKLVLRIGAVTVGKSGGITAQFPIPAQLLAYVASGAFDQIDVSLTPDTAYKAEVAQAKKQKRLPHYTGADILRGRITGPAVKK